MLLPPAVGIHGPQEHTNPVEKQVSTASRTVSPVMLPRMCDPVARSIPADITSLAQSWEVVMVIVNTFSPAELLQRLSLVASSHGGTPSMPDDHTVKSTLTAIKAKWLLGGRTVTSTFTCVLDPSTHEAHFRESAFENSWGLPPPTFTVQTTSQYGSRVKETRVQKSVGGGGTLDFGAFRESVERTVKDAGWEFLYEVL